MATASDAANVLEPLHGHPFLTSQVTLKGVGLSGATKLLDVAVTEVLDPGVGVHPRLGKDLLGTGQAHAIDVSEGDLHPLVTGDVDAGNPSHWGKSRRNKGQA